MVRGGLLGMMAGELKRKVILEVIGAFRNDALSTLSSFTSEATKAGWEVVTEDRWAMLGQAPPHRAGPETNCANATVPSSSAVPKVLLNDGLKRFWTTIRLLRKGKQCTVNTVYSGDGVLLTSTRDVVDRWKEYFEDLLNPTNMPSSEEVGPGDLGTGSRISRAEVAEVVKKLLVDKAPGVDDIRPEFLKALDVVGLSWLTRLCNIAWTSGAVPLDWQTGVVVPLFKKITFLSLPDKVYSGVLERRVRRIVEPRIQEEQCGFHSGRGTVDQLYTLSRVFKGAWEFAQPVHSVLWTWRRHLRGHVRSSAIREELGVEPLLLRVERSQMRWLGHLFRMPPGRLPGEVFRACPSGRRPSGRPRTRWRDYVSRLVWEHLGIPPDELEEVAGALLRLLPLRSDPDKR
ncbi:hypothetical protein D4764_19G0000660 [Takifugu flavidus]|uniref:Reverse transcriptase domain-containing protein n=1 Tax=Takifugu flavidus TaxID=433684 RepID=A0A5C6NNI2_9TELE|nr:hypothetical protein D4764_19G0000660 [Takifugu flavidus]